MTATTSDHSLFCLIQILDMLSQYKINVLTERTIIFLCEFLDFIYNICIQSDAYFILQWFHASSPFAVSYTHLLYGL